MSPVGGSILMMRAPKSPSIVEAKGPASAWERSRAVTSSSGSMRLHLVDRGTDLVRHDVEVLEHFGEAVAADVEHHVRQPELFVGTQEIDHFLLGRAEHAGVPRAHRELDALERALRGVRRRAQPVEARAELRG